MFVMIQVLFDLLCLTLLMVLISFVVRCCSVFCVDLGVKFLGVLTFCLSALLGWGVIC